jgi:hypothetical protein
VAETQNKSQKGGLSRGKIALIAVLAVVLLVVLYLQYGGSDAATSVATKSNGNHGRSGAITTKRPSPAPTGKKGQVDSGSPTAVAAVVDEAAWKSPKLTDVVDYDPFALPATFPKPPVAELNGAKGDGLVAAATANDAKKMAEAVAELQMQWEELKQRGVHVIVRERDQYTAMIGDRMVHVGDEINGFTITAIDPTNGVHVERKAAR